MRILRQRRGSTKEFFMLQVSTKQETQLHSLSRYQICRRSQNGRDRLDRWSQKSCERHDQAPCSIKTRLPIRKLDLLIHKAELISIPMGSQLVGTNKWIPSVHRSRDCKRRLPVPTYERTQYVAHTKDKQRMIATSSDRDHFLNQLPLRRSYWLL